MGQSRAHPKHKRRRIFVNDGVRVVRQNKGQTRYWVTVNWRKSRVYLGCWLTLTEARAARVRFEDFKKRTADMTDEVAKPLLKALQDELKSKANTLRMAADEAQGLYSSRYNGVYFSSEKKLYVAEHNTTVQGKTRKVRLGFYADELTAARAFDRFVRYRGEQSIRKLNFPNEDLPATDAATLRAEAKKLTKERKQSRYKGVTLPMRRGTGWVAFLHIESKETGRFNDKCSLGCWATEEQAAEAYDRASLYYLGDNAQLNFPEKKSSYGPAPMEVLQAEARERIKEATTSRYRCVWQETRSGLWVSQFRCEGRNVYVGRFADELTAAKAYDALAWEKLGRNAKLNFHPVTGDYIGGRKLTSEEWDELGRTHSLRSA